jgi:hypothetical protein
LLDIFASLANSARRHVEKSAFLFGWPEKHGANDAPLAPAKASANRAW